jgi:hypothetical protein
MAPPRETRKAAAGCRVHSGWAAVVVVSGRAGAPVVLDRRRIVIADAGIAGSKQPYHYVEMWPLPKAQAFLDRCAARTQQMARGAFREVAEAARVRGWPLSGCAILAASGRPVPTLAEALSSHAMLHTAEGEFYRNAVADASEHCGVRVTRVREKELLERAAQTLRMKLEGLQRHLTELGKPLGAPWSQDEKLAALAAWLMLAGAAGGPDVAARKRKA